MTLKGFILTDVAYEYYQITGKHYNREQARKNFSKLVHINYDTLLKAIDNIHKEQKKLVLQAKKDFAKRPQKNSFSDPSTKTRIE